MSLIVALGTGAASQKPANAANGLYPTLDCVTYDRANNLVTAYWGYENINGVPITPDSSENYFDPPPFFRGQPTTFQPGTYRDVFQTTFDADGTLTWYLFGSSVTANNDPNKYCDGADGISPDTAIINGPSGTVNNSTATFELFATESGVSYECKLDDGDFASCDTPNMLSDLSDGTHTFQARATDTAGNTDPTPATRTWTVDTTAPDAPTIISPANGTRDRDGSFNVRGTAEPGSTVRLYKGTNRVGTSETDPATGAWSIALVDAGEDGSHDYMAKATDAVGNVSAPSSLLTVIVDMTAPKVVAGRPAAGATGVLAGANVRVKFSEAMNASSVNATTIRLRKRGTSKKVAATVAYDPSTNRAILNPNANLEHGATYIATVTTGVKDLAGNALANDKTWSFEVQ